MSAVRSSPFVAPDDDALATILAADARRAKLRDDNSWLIDNPDVLPVPFTWARDYGAIAAPQTIVGGLLEAGTLAVMFGESNTGKSTFALDMAAAVGRGVTWRSRRTRRGVVLWIALESAAGLRRRVHAYRLRHELAPDGMLFADITARVRLLDAGHVARTVSTVRTLAAIAGEPVALIVVDTVARALDGGDENDGRDMGRLVGACDTIRTETGAAVLLIHHAGKDSTRGARGHSSLRAAVDTEIEVSGQANPRQAKVTKQRDLPSGDVFAFDLEPVQLATDPDTGEAITACVVVHRDDVIPTRKMPSGRNRQAMLGAVRQWVAEHGDIIPTPDWHKLCKAQSLAKSRWSEVRESLVRDGWLIETIGGVRYAP